MVILIAAVVVAHGVGFSAPGPGADPMANTTEQMVDQPDEDTPPESSNEAPTATFEIVPQNPVTEQPITLDATDSTDPDGSITSYEWDFDGDSTPDATGEQVTHTFTVRGEQPITLTVTDDMGATNETMQTVSIIPVDNTTNQSPTAQLSAEPATIPSNEPVTLDATTSTDPDGDDLIYEWAIETTPDDTEVDLPSGPRGEITLSTPGEYVFRVTVSDGNTTDTATTTVTVRESDDGENETNDGQDESNDDENEPDDNQDETNDGEDESGEGENEPGDGQDGTNDDQDESNDDEDETNDGQDESDGDQDESNDDEDESDDDQEESDDDEDESDEGENEPDDGQDIIDDGKKVIDDAKNETGRAVTELDS